jgi:hypothetical protein
MLCAGKNPRRNGNKIDWYGFIDIPISEDTRCQYCYLKLQELKNQKKEEMFRIASYPGNITCDSMTDDFLSSMNYNDFNFQIISDDKQIPYIIHDPNIDERSHGIFVVEMLKNDKYGIQIDNRRRSKTYYTFNMKVGSRDIVINKNQVIYYNNKVFISGFNDRNFKFEDDTTITIDICEFKRISKLNYRFVDYKDFHGTTHILDPLANHVDDKCDFTKASPELFKPCDKLTIRTTPTDDEFRPLARFSVTIKLVHAKPIPIEYYSIQLEEIKCEQTRRISELTDIIVSNIVDELVEKIIDKCSTHQVTTEYTTSKLIDYDVYQIADNYTTNRLINNTSNVVDCSEQPDLSDFVQVSMH